MDICTCRYMGGYGYGIIFLELNFFYLTMKLIYIFPFKYFAADDIEIQVSLDFTGIDIISIDFYGRISNFR